MIKRLILINAGLRLLWHETETASDCGRDGVRTMMPTETKPFTPLSTMVPRLDMAQSTVLPITMAAKRRNTALDWLFYDVNRLTAEEFRRLVVETNLEGSILVVHPRAPGGASSVRKFDDHAELRAAPGRPLERFTIAGVGSSDVGAAAFARTVADHYGEPVGAIIAGYGVADVLAEAMGGWFVLGLSNRLMKNFHDQETATMGFLNPLGSSMPGIGRARGGAAAERPTGSPDSDTLLKLLLDKNRTIKSLVGHSKGCLSIAYALQTLAESCAKDALAKAKKIHCVTTGAVVEFPDGFDNVAQYLGEHDWFGCMNSRDGVPREIVPNAWHHLNTRIPFHMDMHAILDRADC